MKSYDSIIVGAGLTGLTAAYRLILQGKRVLLLEAAERTGGQIHTHTEAGFTFESGPNTGVLSNAAVVDLFEKLSPTCNVEVAHPAAKRRLIWKKNGFRALPSGLLSGVSTPLFAFKDKLRILLEPFRAKGTNPNESVGELAKRRLGKSFVDYAVDPFISGIYAGDPYKLVTRYALPKLYNLEQQHGSFIRGTIAKAKQPKTEEEKRATKEVFSAKGGLQRLTDALAKQVGEENIILSAKHVAVMPSDEAGYTVRFEHKGEQHCYEAKRVITTCGAYALPEVLPFLSAERLAPITCLNYAPVVQVCVCIAQNKDKLPKAFGGLIPSLEKKEALGILFPSDCFQGRTPSDEGKLYSFFFGGMKKLHFIEQSDEDIREQTLELLHDLFGYPQDVQPDVLRIFRHQHAIPQYDDHTGQRFEAIETIERDYPGLSLAGNIKGGISMADRIRQAYELTKP